MPRHAVKLLATIGACSVFALALSSGVGAVEVEVNTPHINVPTPHVNVPKPHITVPTVNLRHHRQSTGTNTLTNEKLNATTTTVKTPVVGPSNGGGSAGAKIIIESVGGSGSPSGVQQQNAAAAAAAAAATAAAIGSASTGAGSPGGAAKTVDIPGPPQSGNTGLNKDQPESGYPSIANTAAFYNALLAGADNATYAADMSALEAAACPGNPNLYICAITTKPSAAVTALVDFQAQINYLLFLLGLTQHTAYTGYNGFTPYETALIEAAMTACLNSPSTCAATIANLETELQSLGVPASIPWTGPNATGTMIQVFYTLAQIDGDPPSVFSIYAAGAISEGGALSAQVANAKDFIANSP